MKKVKLIEICNPKQWKTISISDLKDNGFPVYGANGIIGYYDKYTHKNPTILITCRGATCGTINISIPKSYVNGNAMALDNLSENANINFVAYSLISRGLKDVISGSAQPQITREGLAKVTIILPPLPQQKAIAAQLDKAQELIQYNEQLIEKYDELQQSLFLDMFGDPVVNEKGWEMVELKNVCEIRSGKNQKLVENEKGKYPIIGSGGIMGYADNYICPKGTVVLGRKGTINKPFFMNEKFWNVDTAFGLIANNIHINSLYLFYFSIFFNFLKLNVTVTIPSLRKIDLYKINIPTPPLSLQNEFASHIESIELQKEQAKEALAKSKDIFQGLLQEHFSN